MASRQQFDDFIVTYLETARKHAEIYVKNPDDAEDVVSESIEKALRSIHNDKDSEIIEPRKMRNWFSTIIVNTAIDHLRKQSQNASIEQSLPVSGTDDFLRLEFESLFDILPFEDQKIITLRFYDNLSLKEIAIDMKMKENTVKTRLYRSLKKLRLEITDGGYRVNTKKDKTPAKTLGIVVMAALLTAILTFNLSPALAVAAYDISILGDIVRVITFNRFDYNSSGYTAEINVPEIQGLLDAELQDRLNAEFSEYADDLILSFESTILEAEEFGDDTARMSIKADYAVRTDNDRILALDTWLTSDINGYFLHKFYTLDKRSGHRIELKDLFAPDADYITPISEYLVTEMIRLNAEENGVYFVTGSDYAGNHFTAIRPDQNFYISDRDKLVICFDKYEIGAGFMGSPEFVIPAAVIADIVRSELID